jgi:trk system potassium uptake protein TrkH
VILFLTMLVLLMIIAPLDFASAFSAVAASINNLGPGLGEVSLNYAGLPAGAKWLLVVAMVLGRLEIFTLLVLLTPAFWRR